MPFHKEMPRFMRDREPCAPVVFRSIRENAAGAAHIIRHQHAFEPVETIGMYLQNVECLCDVEHRDTTLPFARQLVARPRGYELG